MRSWFHVLKEKSKYLDYYILIPVILLCAIGIVMVYSATSDYVVMKYNESAMSYLMKQAGFMVVGFILMSIVYTIRLSALNSKRFIIFILGITFVLLLYLFILARVKPSGSSVNGAVAWIPIGPFHIQPTEIAKLTLILYLAYIFSIREERLGVESFKQLYLGPIILCFVMMAIVLVQPDLGGTTILFGIGFVMLMTSGLRYSTGIIWTAIFGGALWAIFSLLINLHVKSIETNYMYRRIIAFTKPFKYENTDGKQLINSYYAINNGSWIGKGLGNSIEKKGYLPEPYTDFILAIISEELGFIGVIVVLGLLFFLIGRMYVVAIRTKDTFGSLVGFGVATMFLIQSTFNIGGVVGLLPITGVTLPFISYGGSSLLILFITIGLILNVSAMNKQQRQQEGVGSHGQA